MAAAAGSGAGRAGPGGGGAGSAAPSASVTFCGAPLPRSPSRRAESSRCFWFTTKRPTKSALPSWSSSRRRPSAMSSGISSATDTATPIGVTRHTSKLRRSGLFCDCPPEGSLSSDTVPAEHLFRVCQLARVFDQEARAADELVGLLRQDALVAFCLVLLVGRFFVLGFVLHDEPLLEDHVEARLDGFVVGLFLFLLVFALAGLLDHCGGRRREDLVDLVDLGVIFLVDVDDIGDDVVIVVLEGVYFEVRVVDVDV